VPVGAQLGRAGVGLHGAHRALHGLPAAVGTLRADPGLADLQVHHVALFQVDDLVRHPGQGHGVGGQEVLAHALAGADAQHQG